MGLRQNLFLGVFTWWHSRPSILLLVKTVTFIILLSLKLGFIHVTYNKLLLFQLDATCGGLHEMLPISLGPSNTGSLVGGRLRRITMRRCVALLGEACHWGWGGVLRFQETPVIPRVPSASCLRCQMCALFLPPGLPFVVTDSGPLGL